MVLPDLCPDEVADTVVVKVTIITPAAIQYHTVSGEYHCLIPTSICNRGRGLFCVHVCACVCVCAGGRRGSTLELYKQLYLLHSLQMLPPIASTSAAAPQLCPLQPIVSTCDYAQAVQSIVSTCTKVVYR